MEGRAAAALLLVLALMGAVTAEEKKEKRLSCGPVCLMYCPNGNVLDEHGCPLCKCREDVCQLPSETGMCRGYFPKFFHNPKTGACEQFIYGGCGGNGNNFDTKEACQAQCSKQKRSMGDVCQLPSETGMCRGYFPKFFHNPKTGACEQFIYGGCGGNGNNFDTKEACQAQCSKQKRSTGDVCQLPSETGMCRGYFPKFFFNSKTGACERFIYGGCGGNGNNFDTKEACQAQCSKNGNVCQLPSETGMCRGYFPKYFHNSKTGACEQFIYGGCGGNGNNFDTKEACQAACS